VWSGDKRLDYENFEKVSASSLRLMASDRVTISNPARQLALQLPNLEDPDELRHFTGGVPMDALLGVAKDDEEEEFDDLLIDPILKFKLLLIEALTGEKVMIFDADQYSKDRARAERQAQETAEEVSANRPTRPGEPARQGWGVVYTSHEEIKEVEQASFNARGVVKTADGQTINFETNLEMSRERITVHDVTFTAGDPPKDPLVINYSGKAAELLDEKTEFDIDADGRQDSISFVRNGSGFLVLDRNNDGIINNGTELFGPKTGEGFQELAQHDEDGNGWIDESDTVYSKLNIWTKDDAGQDQLFTLKEKNVGAIYLDSAGTAYSLRDSQNETQGAIRTTGLYLSDDGQPGTVQQIDLKT
jgi:hypothetical protein